MALTKDQKRAQLDDLKTRLGNAQSVIFTHYIGMTVAEVSELRRKLRAAGADMKVAKKTLMRLAAKDQGLEIADEMMPGPVACIFSDKDPIVGAQVAYAFGKDHKQVSFLGGIFEGKILKKEDAISLANIPGKQVLLAMFAMMIRSPLVSFAGMCSSPLTGFARGLSELAKKKESAPAAA